MISEKIRNAAEKAMPKEKRFVEKAAGFFKKKSHRLIVSGVLSAVLICSIYELEIMKYDNRFDVLLVVLGFIHLTATGAFFANINTFSLKKFAAAVSVCSVVMYSAAITLGVISAMDTTKPETALASWLGNMLFGIPTCAIFTALTVLSAYFAVVRRKA